MNNLIALTITTLLFYLTGSPYALLLSKQTLLEHLSLSFLIGSGLSTFLWFIAYLLSFPLTITSLLLASLAGFVTGLLLAKTRKQKLKLNFTKLTFNKRAKYLSLTAITFILLALVISNYNPITAWDALTLYDFRGKIIALQHSLVGIENNAYHLSYPLMTSLTHAIVYLFKGTNPQPLYVLTFFSLVSIVFSRLTNWTNQRFGLVASLLLLSSQPLWSLSIIAYTNIPYTTLLVTSLLYAVNPVNKKNSHYLLISGLLLGLSTWVRSAETFWMIGIFIVLWQGIRLKKKLLAVFSSSLVLLFRFTWSNYYLEAYEKLNHQTTKLTSLISLKTLNTIINNFQDITHYATQNIIYPFLGVWIMALATIPALIILIKTKKSPANLRLLQLFTIAVLIFLMTIAGISVFSTYYETWDAIGGSAQRMLVFIIPLVLTTSLYSYHLLTKNNEK